MRGALVHRQRTVATLWRLWREGKLTTEQLSPTERRAIHVCVLEAATREAEQENQRRWLLKAS